MGKSAGRNFGLEFMIKWKLQQKNRKLLNMIVPNFLYTKSMLLYVVVFGTFQSK